MFRYLATIAQPLTQRLARSLLLASCSVTVLTWSAIAQAQMTVSPMVIERQANRNQAEGLFTIQNNGSEPFRIRTYSEPFTYDKEKGFQSLPSSPNDLSPFLQFAPREMTVLPGTTRRVRFVVRFPPNHPQAEYRAVLFAEKLQEVSPDNSGAQQVAITTRIGIAVYVQNGDLSPRPAIVNARIAPQFQRLELLATNSGQASVQAEGNWRLTRNGQAIASGKLVPTTLLAETERYFAVGDLDTLSNSPLDAGDYQLSGELAWGTDDRRQTLPFSVTLSIPASQNESQR